MTCAFHCRRVRKGAVAGFALIGLMMVVILVSIAIPTVTRSLTRSKESVLRSNLSTLRTSLDRYFNDKGKAPTGLQDLVTDGYLARVPTDPMNHYSTRWKMEMEEGPQSDPGVWDVHSFSSKTGLDGTAYSEW